MGLLCNTKKVESNQTPSSQREPAQGQAVIEMVLILPLLLLLIIGALELGRIFFAKITVTNAAREGAFYLSFHLSDSTNCTGTGSSQICFLETRNTAIQEANNSGVTLTNNDIVISPSSPIVGQTLTIKINTAVKNIYLISLLSNGTSIKASKNSFSITSSVEMVAQ